LSERLWLLPEGCGQVGTEELLPSRDFAGIERTGDQTLLLRS
jgi:hypothetical protein